MNSLLFNLALASEPHRNSIESYFALVAHEQLYRSNMKVKIIFLFLIGFTIGFTFKILVTQIMLNPVPSMIFDGFESKKMNESQSIVDDVENLRIFCLILTSQKNHQQKAIHVRNTWGRHCNKLLFVSTLTDLNLESIGFNVIDDHDHLWGKVKLAIQYVYKNFIDDYDWFYKADDDTFAIIENMRYFVAAYSTDDPIYFGHKFQSEVHRFGYFSGGSGYVMSRKSIRLFVENVLTNDSVCDRFVGSNVGDEDWNIGYCFDKIGIYAGDSTLNRERFLPFDPKAHLFPRFHSHPWYLIYQYYSSDEGLDCCSDYSIAFHYISPSYMYTLYYLTYYLKIHGVKYRNPLLPRKMFFRDIVHMLENERKNITATKNPRIE